MLSQGVIEEVKHVGKPLGMGNSQPLLHFDHDDEECFEILKENNIAWVCYPQRILVPGEVEPMEPPILATVGCPPESHCWNEQPRADLNCRL